MEGQGMYMYIIMLSVSTLMYICGKSLQGEMGERAPGANMPA